jgi:hypothetical protein
VTVDSTRRSWTDERLDELNGRVDGVGDRVELTAEMKAGFGAIHRQMFHASVVLGAALIGLIAAVLAK